MSPGGRVPNHSPAEDHWSRRTEPGGKTWLLIHFTCLFWWEEIEKWFLTGSHIFPGSGGTRHLGPVRPLLPAVLMAVRVWPCTPAYLLPSRSMHPQWGWQQGASVVTMEIVRSERPADCRVPAAPCGLTSHLRVFQRQIPDAWGRDEDWSLSSWWRTAMGSWRGTETASG